MYAKYAVRDAIVVAITAGFWWLAADLTAGSGPVSDLGAFLAGALFTASAFVLHEWGHLLAGLACGSRLEANTKLQSGFTFSFDAKANTLRQFVIMSFGGFAATAALVAFAYLALPDGWLASRVARGGALFLALLGVTLELPLLLTAVVRGAVPDAVAVPLERQQQPDAVA